MQEGEEEDDDDDDEGRTEAELYVPLVSLHHQLVRP